MSVLSNTDKLLEQPFGVNVTVGDRPEAPQPQQFNIPGDTSQQQSNTATQPIDNQSSVISPGSVGSPSSTNVGGAPAWTNIQAYLRANPQQSPAVANFDDHAESLAQKDRDSLNQYKEFRRPFDEVGDIRDKVKNLTVPQIGTYLRHEKGTYNPWKPWGPINTDHPENVSAFLNHDIGSVQLSPTETSQSYKDLESLSTDRDAFDQYVNRTYRDAAGRDLTSGQQALQRQIDLSGGELADVREMALQKLAGLQDVQDQRSQYNANLAADEQYLNDAIAHQNSLRSQMLSSGDLYTKKLAENRWNPDQQRMDEYRFQSGFINPANNLANAFWRDVARQEGYGSNIAGVKAAAARNGNKYLVDATSRISQGLDANNPDVARAALQILADKASSIRATWPEDQDHTDIGRSMGRLWNDWMANSTNRAAYNRAFK